MQDVPQLPKINQGFSSSAKKSRQNRKKENKKYAQGQDPNNPVRVYCDGVFDLFHFGHARVLQQAKRLFKYTYLIVGVSGDQQTIQKKGKIILSQKQRSLAVAHCKWADQIICPCPWILTIKFLKQNNIDYVAHDAIPYGSAGQDDIYAQVKRHGMFKETQRTEGVSTSDIVLRIVRDYDDYIWRNLKRGYTAKDLNITEKKAAQVKKNNTPKVNWPMGEGFDEKVEKLRDKIHSIFTKWRKNSDKFVQKFLKKYENRKVGKYIRQFISSDQNSDEQIQGIQPQEQFQQHKQNGKLDFSYKSSNGRSDKLEEESSDQEFEY